MSPPSSGRPSKGRADANKPKRLNQLLASAGFGSRRQCEELIKEGRVDIDGEIVTELSVHADPNSHKIRVDGVVLRPQKLVYYAVHKPVGIVSTNRDPQGRPRVIDLVPPTERVYPVGRLDKSSDGLMLLTNDGNLAQQLAHPKFGVQKVYRVTVAGMVKPETMRKMRQGIYIAEGKVQVDGARILKARGKATDMEIRLREGKNREIRRILAKFGHKVQRLRRIAIGPLRLGDTPAGAYRKLTRDEVAKLRAIGQQAESSPSGASVKTGGRKSATKKSDPDSKKTGTKKSATSKKTNTKRPSQRSSNAVVRANTPVSKKRVSKSRAGNRSTAKQRKSPRERPPERSSLRVGSVIGGDEPAAPKRSAAKRGSTSKRGVGNAKRKGGKKAAKTRGGSTSRGTRQTSSRSQPRKANIKNKRKRS